MKKSLLFPVRLALALALSLALLACDDEPGADGGPDSDADADLEPDADGDEADADAEQDGEPDGDLDPDAEADLEADVELDAEPDADPESPAPPTEADRERLSAIIEALSADDLEGRLTGTASGDRAEELVLGFLEDHGVETATQDVTFPLFVVHEPAELSLLDETGEVKTTLSYIDDYREVDFSGSGVAEGELVFVSYGLELPERDDYAGVDVRGRIAVILTNVPPATALVPEDDGRLDVKINTAFEHGAVGVIFVPAQDEALSDDASPLESELTATDKYGDFHEELHHPELPVAFVHVGSVEALLGLSQASLVRAASGTTFERTARLEINGDTLPEATCQNVFGILRGADEEVGDEVVILGAHYDHLGVGADGRIFNGATDNATGTGIVLETAARLAESGLEPRRTTLFAFFCAEEQGLRGSFEYAYYGTPLFPLRDTLMMVQVDAIGEEDGPYLTNPTDDEVLATFLGEETSAEVLPIQFADWGGECASDDCIFLWLEVPAFRFVSYGAYHHVAEDDFGVLDLDRVDRVADVCIRGLERLCFE